jgi:transcriptional regulator with XRE-family HTH domain
MDGRIHLNTNQLKKLRKYKGYSQEKLAFECSEHYIQISLATIKRAETGKSVLYRTAASLAQFYQISIEELINVS